MNDAQSYLEHLQEIENDRRGISLQDREDTALYYTRNSQMRNNELQQKLESLDNEMLESRGYSLKKDLVGLVLPTKYENPYYYKIMKDRFKEIKEEAGNLKKSSSSWNFEEPVFGTLPTGQINAMAIQVPNSNDHLIVFEEELIALCNLLSKIIAQSVPLKMINGKQVCSFEKSDIANHLNENPSSLMRFNELIYSFVIHGRASVGTQYNLDRMYSKLTTLFNRSIELFIFGHEYGHLAQWQSEKNRIVGKKFGTETVNEVYSPWEEEFISDMIGFDLMTSIMMRKYKEEPIWSLTGIQIILQAIHILDNVESIIKSGNEINYLDSSQINPEKLSHPPANMRWKTLKKLISEKIGEEIFINATMTQSILSTLWQKTIPKIRQLHEKHVNIDLRWD